VKIVIKRPVKWIGPWQVASFLVGWFSPVLKERLSEYINNSSRATSFLEKVNSLRKRKDTIKIDTWDAWSADITLACVIHPMLVMVKKTKHGSPYVDDADIPENLGIRKSQQPAVEVWECDGGIHKRWDWVLDEIIWTFSTLSDFDGGYNTDNAKRIENGLRLFGKYYQGLWT
jgi:hypothetical protein